MNVWHFSCKFPHKMALVKCPCAFRLRRLPQNETSHTEILPRDLLSGACTEILTRDLFWRSCSEPRDLLQRSCQKISYRDLVQRSCQETSDRDLAQRPGEESSDLSQRSFKGAWTEILLWGPSQRSSVAISYREISFRVLPRDTGKSHGDRLHSVAEILPIGLLHKSCEEISFRLLESLYRRFHMEILYRDIA